MTYGLGSENQDLPGFVVLHLRRQNSPDGGKRCWGSGFLPTAYQGVQFRSQGDPVLYLDRPARALDGGRAATRSTRCATSTSASLDELGDPEIADPHRAVRDGLPHADAASRS